MLLSLRSDPQIISPYIHNCDSLCKGDQSGALQEIPQLNYTLWNMLQPTSRRFLRELDEAPGGNNL